MQLVKLAIYKSYQKDSCKTEPFGNSLASVSRNEALERTAGFGLSPPTCAVQQVGSDLGYSGRCADSFEKAARDPEPVYLGCRGESIDADLECLVEAAIVAREKVRLG